MRKSFGFFLAALIVLSAATASAERGRGRRQPAEPPIPHSDNIAKAMEGVEWNWGHQKIISHFSRKLGKLYRPLLAKERDAVREDRLRREMQNRQRRIEKSFVKFTGQRTGWDSSFLRTEFTHNNGEALVEVRQLRTGNEDPRYTDYFLFINGNLWRQYRAFNQDAFGGIEFEQAAGSFQKHFGPAKQFRDEEGAMNRLAWQDGTTKLEAIDNTQFYGFFCLVFTNMETESRLAELRTNKAAAKRGLNPLVEALDDTDERDRHTNVVEHITGKRYKTAQPQEPVENNRNSKRPDKAPQKAKASSIFDEPSRPSKNTGDPLDDLEI